MRRELCCTGVVAARWETRLFFPVALALADVGAVPGLGRPGCLEEEVGGGADGQEDRGRGGQALPERDGADRLWPGVTRLQALLKNNVNDRVGDVGSLRRVEEPDQGAGVFLQLSEQLPSFLRTAQQLHGRPPLAGAQLAIDVGSQQLSVRIVEHGTPQTVMPRLVPATR